MAMGRDLPCEALASSIRPIEPGRGRRNPPKGSLLSAYMSLPPQVSAIVLPLCDPNFALAPEPFRPFRHFAPYCPNPYGETHHATTRHLRSHSPRRTQHRSPSPPIARIYSFPDGGCFVCPNPSLRAKAVSQGFADRAGSHGQERSAGGKTATKAAAQRRSSPPAGRRSSTLAACEIPVVLRKKKHHPQDPPRLVPRDVRWAASSPAIGKKWRGRRTGSTSLSPRSFGVSGDNDAPEGATPWRGGQPWTLRC
jgi:hypothetical protein